MIAPHKMTGLERMLDYRSIHQIAELPLNLCMYVHVCMYVLCTFIYIYEYVCVCVCI